MLHRWSAATATPAPALGTNGIRFGVPRTNILKYNSLCREINDLAFDACTADDTYTWVSTMTEEAKHKVAAMRKARGVAQQEGEEGLQDGVHQQQHEEQQQQHEAQQQKQEATGPPGSSALRNPSRIKPKGRPSKKEKRRKPLVELREEANKKRRKNTAEPKKKKEVVMRPNKCHIVEMKVTQ
jgi:hypothetical protein